MTTLSYETPLRARAMSYRSLLAQLGPLVGLVFVTALFSALRPDTFLTIGNGEMILRQTAVVGTAALGMALIIISGGIDLSVGSAIALVSVCIALFLPHAVNDPNHPGRTIVSLGVAPILAAAGGITVGALLGLSIGSMVVGHVGRVFSAILGLLVGWYLRGQFVSPAAGWTIAVAAGIAVTAAGIVLNEWLVKRVELLPFIVTLGTWGAFRGLAKLLADSSMVYSEKTWLNALLKPIHADRLWLLTPGVWMMVILAMAAAAMLRYTRFGRHVFAIGSNEQTARLCGVNVERTKILIYTLAAVFTGLAGLLQYSYLGLGDPTTANGAELDIIAAVVIGGASLSGGQGSILGTIVGALIMSVVASGCTKMGWRNEVQQIVTGGIIVLAVSIDRLRTRRA